MYQKKTDTEYLRHTIEEVERIDAIIIEKYDGTNTESVALECVRTKKQIWSAVSRIRAKGIDLPKTKRVYPEGAERVNQTGRRQIKEGNKWVTQYKIPLMSRKERDRLALFVKDHYQDMTIKDIGLANGVSGRTISEYISKLKAQGVLKNKIGLDKIKKRMSKVSAPVKKLKAPILSQRESRDFVTKRVDTVYTTKRTQQGLIPVRTDGRTVKYFTAEQANNYYANQRQNG